MTIDPFRLAVALIPLAAYFWALGRIGRQKRPWLVGGGRDLAGLAVGIAGLAVIGPLELFMPVAAAARFGQYVWIFLLALYGLLVTFVVLVSRPRLVVYNITGDRLRPVLSETALGIDPDARWAGESLVMPGIGIQLHLETMPLLRNVSLVASGHEQHLVGWQRLEHELSAALAGVRSEPHTLGSLFCGLSILLVGSVLAYMMVSPDLLADGFREMCWQ
jgi:hypothetical protein